MRVALLLAIWGVSACSRLSEAPPEVGAAPAAARPEESSPTNLAPSEFADSFVVRGATVLGRGRVDLLVRDGRLAALEEVDDGTPVLDLGGRFLVPAFIDSHVHLAYAFDPPTLARGGIAAAVDLASPLPFLARSHEPVQLLAAGPMITAPGGYPTRSWGAGGYGLEVPTVDAAREAVDRLADAGAAVIKVPIGLAPELDDDQLAAVVARAHERHLPVAAHALRDADAARAAAFGVDILAHTPVEPLTDATVQAWRRGTVISTLTAFGGSRDTIDNLRSLRAAGATILYGTDLGNTRVPGIDPDELAALSDAGLDGEALLAAGTSSPARRWGLDGLGVLDDGARASFLVLADDPRSEPLSLERPVAVFIDGRLQAPAVGD